jgi:hypothetical protein
VGPVRQSGEGLDDRSAVGAAAAAVILMNFREDSHALLKVALSSMPDRTA